MASISVAISFSFLPTRPPISLAPPRPNRPRSRWLSPIRASSTDPIDSSTRGSGVGVGKVGFLERRVGELRGVVASLPPSVAAARKNIGLNFVAGLCFGIAVLAIIARKIIVRSQEHANRGSIADLVRRGQLKSERRGIAKPRLCDDPFNNPLVKIDEGNSTARMFGKDYRLAPVKLTKEQQAMHQKRRSRAYQWKRPTVFLKEGDSMPPDVDPDTVRWIPANHPFAAASSDIDEEIAKQNVYQKDGVPFHVRAEHEALQKRLEASKDVPKFPPSPTNMQEDLEEPVRLSGESLGNLQEQPELDTAAKNQNGHIIFESVKDSADDRSQSEKPEGQ